MNLQRQAELDLNPPLSVAMTLTPSSLRVPQGGSEEFMGFPWSGAGQRAELQSLLVPSS